MLTEGGAIWSFSFIEGGVGTVVIFHKIPNMSRDMFTKKTFPMDGFSENEPVLGHVKFTLGGF